MSEFYASTFAQILQASQSASKAKFEHAIDCVRNVRDAWREVARDPEANPDAARVAAMPARRQAEFSHSGATMETAVASHWTA